MQNANTCHVANVTSKFLSSSNVVLCLILQQQYICIHQCLLCVLEGTEDEHIYDNVAPANVNIAFEGKEYFS